VRSPWSPLFHAEQSHLSQSLFIGEVLQPYEHPCGLLWICSNRSMLFLCWGAPELNADLQVGSPKNRAEATLALLAVPFFVHPRVTTALFATVAHWWLVTNLLVHQYTSFFL